MGIILNLFIVVGQVNYVIVVGYTRILHGNFFYHCGPNQDVQDEACVS